MQVHIIEARELKPKDLEGTSDPVVYVEAFGQKFNTPVVPKCLSAVFDETFIINARNLDKEVFEQGRIWIKVMDADTLTRNDLIGSYTVDASFIYFKKDHEQVGSSQCKHAMGASLRTTSSTARGWRCSTRRT